MSLINDALKKAQRQREAAATPPPADAPKVDASAPVQGSHVARIARRRAPIPARTLMLLVTGGVLLAVTAAVIAVVLLNLDTIPPAPLKPALARRPAPPAPAPITVSMPPAKPAAGEASTSPEPAKPAAPVVATSFLSSTDTPSPALPPDPAPRVASPPAVVLPVVNPAANAFLDAANVSGVRADGADSKIIINNRVVRIGDIVDPATGLRLVQVDASNLVFTDANGLKYEKSLR